MTVDYRLHYAPDNASLIIRLALEALHQPYETVLVDRAAQGQQKPDYLALNPNGLIPTLETPTGPIFETGAILLWLADHHHNLAPTPQDQTRGQFLKWLFFTSNTLHAGLRILFYPEKYAGNDQSAQTSLSDQMEILLNRHFSILNTVAGEEHCWLFGDNPSVLDYYIVACLRWAVLYPKNRPKRLFELANYSHLHALSKHIESRPEAIAVSQVEGLGSTPFSAPRHARPLEGSTT